MKTTSLATLALLLLTSSVMAQTAAESTQPPNLTILQKSWVKEDAVSSDSLGRNEDLMRQVRAEKAVIERRDQSLPNQPTQEAMPIPGRTRLGSITGIDPYYVYRIKIRNDGAKTITRIYWEYQFVDPGTQQLMGTRRFFSKLKLKPGESRRIAAFSRRQPAVLVSANQLDKKYQDQFEEKLIIHRIHYSDGTAWQRPEVSPQ